MFNYKHIYDKDSKKLFHEHRIVVEEAIGRKLMKDEIVHHKDGNILNNGIENLEVLPRCVHLAIHDFYGHGSGIHLRKVGEDNTAWCASCKAFLPIIEFHKCESRWNGVQPVCKGCRRIQYLSKGR